jgi:hypothetical protein
LRLRLASWVLLCYSMFAFIPPPHPHPFPKSSQTFDFPDRRSLIPTQSSLINQNHFKIQK